MGNNSEKTRQGDLTLELLNGRLDSITEKFELDQKSLLKRLGTWGGVVALCLSIVVGGFEIYSRTVQKSKDRLAEQLILASEISGQLLDYSTEIAELIGQGQNATVASKYPLIIAQRIRLLNQFEELDGNVIENLNSVDLTLLSNEYSSLGYSERALELAKLGVVSADRGDDYTMRIESRRYYAQALAVSSPNRSLVTARQIYHEAINIADSQEYLSSLNLKLGLHDSWISTEIANKECDKANVRIIKFYEFMHSSPNANYAPTLDEINQRYSQNPYCKFGVPLTP
ncbi:MAG: hypothetical protein COB36_13720 [Alphaproteobacteria bacterium]|nr:MAG: hypothetical protein COB36_13720 [Alphaproteobacteria bacterium]